MKNKKLYYGLGALGALLVVTLAAFALNGAGSNLSGSLNNVAVKLPLQKNIPGLAPASFFTTDNIPPTVEIAAPIIGAKIPGQMFTIIAYANDNVKVSKVVFLNGDSVLPQGILYKPNVENSNNYKYYFDTSKLPNNTPVLLSVWAYDAANNIDKKSVSVTANYNTEKSPPIVTIDSPYDGQTILEGSFTIFANAKDNTKVTKVEFQIDGKLVKTLTEPDKNTKAYKYTFSTVNLPKNKLIPISVWAYDAAGNRGYKTISIKLDNQAAGLTITSPKVGEIIGPQAIVGNDYASRNLVLKVSGSTTEDTTISYVLDSKEVLPRTENSIDFAYVVSPVYWKETTYNDALHGKYTKVEFQWGKVKGSLTAGEHTLIVTAEDKSSNISKKIITFNVGYSSNTKTEASITIKSIQ